MPRHWGAMISLSWSVTRIISFLGKPGCIQETESTSWQAILTWTSGSEDYRDNGGNAEEYAYRSLFGRMTYSYADRYLIQANLRRDGSSFCQLSLGQFSFRVTWLGNFWREVFQEYKYGLVFLPEIERLLGKLGNERIGAYDDDSTLFIIITLTRLLAACRCRWAAHLYKPHPALW